MGCETKSIFATFGLIILLVTMTTWSIVGWYTVIVLIIIAVSTLLTVLIGGMVYCLFYRYFCGVWPFNV